MKKVFALIVTILLGLSFYAYRLLEKTPKPFVPPLAEYTGKDVLDTALEQSDIPEQSNTRVPKGCENSWLVLVESSLKDLKNNFDFFAEALGTKECILNSSYPKFQILLKDCQGVMELTNNREAKERALESCTKELSFYRAFVIHQLTFNSKDYRNMSTRVLMNKLVALLQEEKINVKDINLIGDALAANEKHLYSAQKANLVAKTFALTQSGTPENNFEQYQKSLETLQGFNQNDPELIEADILPDVVKGDWKSVESKVDNLIDENKHLGIAYYFKSGISWRNKDVSSARNFLDKAIHQEPENETYLETRRKIAKMQPGQSGAYTLKMNFDFMNI